MRKNPIWLLISLMCAVMRNLRDYLQVIMGYASKTKVLHIQITRLNNSALNSCFNLLKTLNTPIILINKLRCVEELIFLMKKANTYEIKPRTFNTVWIKFLYNFSLIWSLIKYFVFEAKFLLTTPKLHLWTINYQVKDTN